jgi:hypothetical protein
MRFTDFETTNKLDLVKSMIKAKLGISDSVIPARKCSIRELKAFEVRSFLDNNHISGFANAKHYLGLVYENQLVFVMSFGHPRFTKTYDWEIIRVATAMNTTVVGGISKVYSYFRKMYSGQTIMTYSDLRVGCGKAYHNLGMKLVRTTAPGYFYCDGKQVYNRFHFQKRNIQSMCPKYDSSLSEAENAFNNGYLKYWDCGNLVFEDVL